MQHLDEGTIHAWLDGALPPLEAEQAAKHAAECASCAAAVAEARGIIAGSARIVSALDAVPGGVIPGRKTRPTSGSSAWRRLRLTPGRAALAATILLAVSTTLTLRSSSSPSPSNVDSTLFPKAAVPAAAAAPALARSVTLDSIKGAGAGGSPSIANAALPQKTKVAAPSPRAQMVAEQREMAASRREVADVAAARDTAARDTATRAMAKARVAAQDAAAGASAAPSAAPAAAAVVTGLARGNVAQPKMLALRTDSVSTFEGCYRVSVDSASGSTEMPRGLPASFALTRPSPEPQRLAAAPSGFSVNADSTRPAPVWRQLSSSVASVTFGAASARPVSLVLTAGSAVGVASSGDRTTKVRVMRESCPR
ncbi:MAG TPA: zf-HC2 domain-containing protein [Gemmatimonadaceae bacterium]|nr:zf-HC2 domain-containing protein [Gemmatimonadaceae bacterium]